MTLKKSHLWESIGWFVFVLLVFLSLTGVDFVVNNILYSFGLGFYSSWYVPYRIGLSMTVFSICFLVTWQSFSDTGSVGVALKRGLTLFLAYMGGLIDWMFFLVYSRGMVYSGEWTWMWQYSIFGTWNWKLQVVWSLGFLVLIFALWKANIIRFQRGSGEVVVDANG